MMTALISIFVAMAFRAIIKFYRGIKRHDQR
jgi:hypothetical protein